MSKLGELRSLLRGPLCVIGAVVVYCHGLIITERDSRSQAEQTIEARVNSQWQKWLLEANYAEFDRKTGAWYLRKMSDVMADNVLGLLPTQATKPTAQVEVAPKKGGK